MISSKFAMFVSFLFCMIFTVNASQSDIVAQLRFERDLAEIVKNADSQGLAKPKRLEDMDERSIIELHKSLYRLFDTHLMQWVEDSSLTGLKDLKKRIEKELGITLGTKEPDEEENIFVSSFLYDIELQWTNIYMTYSMKKRIHSGSEAHLAAYEHADYNAYIQKAAESSVVLQKSIKENFTKLDKKRFQELLKHYKDLGLPEKKIRNRMIKKVTNNEPWYFYSLTVLNPEDFSPADKTLLEDFDKALDVIWAAVKKEYGVS